MYKDESCKTCEFKCTWFCMVDELKKESEFKAKYPFAIPLEEGTGFVMDSKGGYIS